MIRRALAKTTVPLRTGKTIVIQLGHEMAVESTGARIWPSANVLVDFLCENNEYVKGKMIVELGSGTGIVGLAAAATGAHR